MNRLSKKTRKVWEDNVVAFYTVYENTIWVDEKIVEKAIEDYLRLGQPSEGDENPYPDKGYHRL